MNSEGRLANILRDLDRCQHGRHQKDSCFDCPDGRSAGNPHLQAGQVIGYTIRGKQIIVPDIAQGQHTGMVKAWVPETDALVAQRTEQQASNLPVEGSNPS